jgi:hypothetical protein
MKKQFLFILLLVAGCVSYAQFTVSINWYEGNAGEKNDTIYYDHDRKLEWNDFKGWPDHNSMAAAITESGFGYRMSMQSKNGRINIEITVYCYFNKKRSWVKRGMDTNYALTHEQHHFDITYINTCLFIVKLKAASFTAGNYVSLVDTIYDDCYEALRKMQDEYDGQTSNGRSKKIQADWNKKIDRMLAGFIIN